MIDYMSLLKALSNGLDSIEIKYLGAATNHAKRTAILCIKMGMQAGMSADGVYDLAVCALMHDCALMEYAYRHEKEAQEKKLGLKQLETFGNHCVDGEKAVRMLPFRTDVTGYILYHHECADGSGPFGKKADETPYGAQLIHMADVIDVTWNMGIGNFTYEELIKDIRQNEGTLFSARSVRDFQKAVTAEFIQRLKEEKAERLFEELLTGRNVELSETDILKIGEMFARIIDFKSPFTSRHSRGIAEKAYRMGEYYDMDAQMCAKLYLAGALHDIGKLMVDNQVLEKEGRLDKDEYTHVQTHIEAGRQMLKEVRGLDDVIGWVLNHHERLDGSGYPDGKKAENLDSCDRLFQVLDMYQALTEERPYKEGFSHEKTMEIICQNVAQGRLDREIAEDVNEVFG